MRMIKTEFPLWFAPILAFVVFLAGVGGSYMVSYIVWFFYGLVIGG